jgi:hypothetical protein
VLYSIGSTGFTVFALVAAGLTKSLITKMTPIPLRQRAVGIMATASAIGRASGPLVASSSDALSAGGYVMFALVSLMLGTVFLGFEALRPSDEVAKTEEDGKNDSDGKNAKSCKNTNCDASNCCTSTSTPEHDRLENLHSATTSEGSHQSLSDNLSCLSSSEDCQRTTSAN